MQNLIGKQLDEYLVQDLLGQGGMARVYRAQDVSLNRLVAVKVINTPDDPDYVRRFKNEAQAIARLEHPNIVRIYRYGEVGGQFYMAMQFIEGQTLRGLLQQRRRSHRFLDLPTVSRLLTDVCAALDYAHTQGVIHRDVKPSNILLDRTGRPYLADFGLARMTHAETRGDVFGSAHYIAPEQAISSAHTVPQSDLYAMGIILYELLAGRVPFDAPELADVALLHLDEPPPPPRQFRPDLAPQIEAVVLRAIAKKPEERYPTGAALSAAFAQAAGISPTEAAATLPPLPAAVAPQPIELSVPDLVPRERARSRKGRGCAFWLFTLVFFFALVTGMMLALPAEMFHQGGDGAPAVTLDPLSDEDGDGMPLAEDACPDQAGLPRLQGCLVTGTITLSTGARNAVLRGGPGTMYTALGNVRQGTIVTVVARDGGSAWLRILNPSSSAEDKPEVWIAEVLVKLDDGYEVKDLPVYYEIEP